LREEEIAKQGKKKRQNRYTAIDPETGKPRKVPEDLSGDGTKHEADFDNYLEQISRDNPAFKDEKFQEYLSELKRSKEIQEGLYKDDHPYDAEYEEQFNDEE